MKPAPFDYLAPDSLEEALAAMQTHGDDAKLLAGGQSLIPVMNFRLAQPALLVDLNRLTNLSHIQANNGHVRMGAMTRHHQIETDPLIAAKLPLLYETMPYIAHPQIRNRGTLGGSLAHADPAAELPVITVALNGRFRLQSSHTDRWVTATDFFVGLFTTALASNEILTEVEIPLSAANTGHAFVELARRHGDYAQAGVAVTLTLDNNATCTAARIVYLNLGEIPMVAEQAATMLVGQALSEALFQETAVAASQKEIEPTTDVHATADYKRHLARVLTLRALRQAATRAQQTL